MGILKLAAGVAVGYVLGSRAGREKYESIAAQARKVGSHPRVIEAQEKAKTLIGTQTDRVNAKLHSAAESARPATTPSTSNTTPFTPAPTPASTPAAKPTPAPRASEVTKPLSPATTSTRSSTPRTGTTTSPLNDPPL
ncbi:hypothetical protein [Actinoplanes couchii]|uniref:Protoporphyrinogen oxidase n=1 Tax=Actinoplanes couchii TaxID=403638 RepID=A0ABQ3XT79_9ACTN|nr:hypothetical protein [Actinoplanes couchii]MDR6317030.1 cell division septation protein DedD [Actinoplanes couchii]GID61723.1 hypothetical protein Aco03nite_101270 [Actinoplanes couchii]